jgi:hypothetical protein
MPRVLIRLFRGVICKGAHDRVLRMLHDEVLPHIESNPAVGHTAVALPIDDSLDEYLVETHWRSVDDLVRFCGDDWQIPRVEAKEEELLVAVSAHHYLTDGLTDGVMADGSTASRPAPQMIRLDEIEIDGPRLQLAWRGSAAHLPSREMSAMLALAADPGAPVSSAELARRIWPGSALVTTYDVRRVIHQLRTLLRSSGTPLEIRSVHGYGYRLELKIAS